MTDIQFNCPKCGKHLSVDAKGAGMDVPCPECSRTIRVPSAAEDVAPIRMKHGGKTYNSTIIIATIILSGSLVGSAFLLKEGMGCLAQTFRDGLTSLGTDIRNGFGYAKPNEITVRLGNAKSVFGMPESMDFHLNGMDIPDRIRIDGIDIPNRLSLSHDGYIRQ